MVELVLVFVEAKRRCVSGGIVNGDGALAIAIVDLAVHAFCDRLEVEEGLVDVVGAPFAVLGVVCQRSDQTPDALVHIDLEKQRGSHQIEHPVASGAEVAIVDDVVSKVVVK